MRVLVLYEYPPLPAGLSTQGELLQRGLREIGVEAYGVHFKSDQEKEWYYRWYQPDFAVGVGYWGYAPHIILHTRQAGAAQPVPWLVANGYIANYRDTLNNLPLILVTSTWVKEVYVRDGVNPEIIEVLPVGCDTDVFHPRDLNDPKVAIAREIMGVPPDEVMILTVGGDAASKGSQEVMRALAMLGDAVPPWRYVCKVWPQARTTAQNQSDLELAEELGILDRVRYVTGKVSRDFMPYLMNACDIYCGPSRLEGFGMPQVEAGACGKPVIATRAMAFLDTLVHGETAFLAGVAVENRVSETILGEESGYPEGHRIVFDPPRIADYRANSNDIADYLALLLRDPALRQRMGEAGRQRAMDRYNYRVVARQFVDILSRRLGAEAPRELPLEAYTHDTEALVAT
ncbi:MAG: glycosyltransferase family 4 protein [Armatimonadota bacterium]